MRFGDNDRDGTFSEAHVFVGSAVEWLRRRDGDRHVLGSKLTRAILLCPWEKTYGIFPCLVVLAAVLNFSHISIKFLPDSSILASLEAGRGNCLPYVLAPPYLSCESGG